MCRTELARVDTSSARERWWDLLRQRRNRWAHGVDQVEPFELIASTAREAEVHLKAADTAEALSLLGLSQAERPAHVGSLLRELPAAINAQRVLDPFVTAPSLLAHIAEAPSVVELVAHSPQRSMVEHLGPLLDDAIRWRTGDPVDLLLEHVADSSESSFDLIASSPPIGLHTRVALQGDLPFALYRQELAF